MKKDSLVARRAAESISLSDLHRTYDADRPEYSLGGEIDDEDRLSKGSYCCGADVYTSDGTIYCSDCAEATHEIFEDDDEYLERKAAEESEKEERESFLDEAFGDEEEGGY